MNMLQSLMIICKMICFHLTGGHIGYASADKYRRNGGRHWRNFVYNMANDWEKMNLDWFYGFLPNEKANHLLKKKAKDFVCQKSLSKLKYNPNYLL